MMPSFSGAQPERGAERWPAAAPVVLQSAAVAIGLLGARLAATTVGTPSVSILALVLSAGVAAALWSRAVGLLPAAPHPAETSNRTVRIAVSAAVFVLAVLVSEHARVAASTMIAPDTAGYWTASHDMLGATPGAVPIRTPFYSALFAAVRLAGGSGRELLFLQFALRALAASAMAWVVSRSSITAGAVVGAAMALDPVSAMTSTSYLTESLYTSGLALSLAVALAQLTRPAAPGKAWLFLTGIFFGTALLVRPTSAALIVPLAFAYLAVTRSPVRTALVAVGYAAVALLIAVYNYARTGLFVIVATGLYLAFPLFVQHLMDPRNGPASHALHEQLAACDPGLDYLNVTVATANEFVYTKLLPCTGGNAANRAAVYRLYARAYREALLARPLVSGWRLFLESARFLAVPASYYTAEQVSFNQEMHVSDACSRKPPYDGYPRALIAFICPVPPGDQHSSALLWRTAIWLRTVYQPYIYSYDPRMYLDHVELTRSPELTGIAGLLFFVFAIALSRPSYRPVVLGAVVVIAYNAAATAYGQVTIPRYVGVLSPFFLIVTVLFAVSLCQDAAASIRHLLTAHVVPAAAEGRA